MFQVAKVRGMMDVPRVATEQGRMSYLSFISKAAVSALSEYRDRNAIFQHELVLQRDEVNLGTAVDLPS